MFEKNENRFIARSYQKNMKKNLHFIMTLSLLFILPSLQTIAYADSQSREGVQVIANTEFVLQSMSSRELARIYANQQKFWKNGQRITVYVLDSHTSLHRTFCQTLMLLQPQQLDRKWNRLTFTGTGMAPTVVDSISMMKQSIINTPGSIGYIPLTEEIPPQFQVEVY